MRGEVSCDFASTGEILCQLLRRDKEHRMERTYFSVSFSMKRNDSEDIS